jgi:hypothetical protein
MSGILASNLSQLFLVAQYELNKDFIAKNICENRNRPQLHCNGKCYLCKKFQKEDKKDQENPERRPENRFDFISDRFAISGISPFPAQISQVFHPTGKDPLPEAFRGSSFHPPRHFQLS